MAETTSVKLLTSGGLPCVAVGFELPSDMLHGWRRRPISAGRLVFVLGLLHTTPIRTQIPAFREVVNFGSYTKTGGLVCSLSAGGALNPLGGSILADFELHTTALSFLLIL